jgi:hypothetical protein
VPQHSLLRWSHPRNQALVSSSRFLRCLGEIDTRASRNWFNADALGVLRGKYPSPFFAIKIGEKAIRKCLRDQLGVLRKDTREKLGQFPTMMSEIGVPYDLDGKRAYKTGDYSNQTRAWDASLSACDGSNALGYTVWTYCPDNLHAWGDRWNGEDLSIWSKDDAIRLNWKRRGGDSRSDGDDSFPPTPYTLTPASSTTLLTVLDSAGRRGQIPIPADLNDGGRALAAICRPSPVVVVGKPTWIDFDIKTSEFVLDVEVASDDVRDEREEFATEIYVPLVHYAALPPRGEDEDEGFASDADEVKKARAGSAAKPLAERGQDAAPALDLDVSVSRGHWEVEGQTLKWWYVRPLPGTEPFKVEIRIKRLGGAIPALREQCEFNNLSFLLRAPCFAEPFLFRPRSELVAMSNRQLLWERVVRSDSGLVAGAVLGVTTAAAAAAAAVLLYR